MAKAKSKSAIQPAQEDFGPSVVCGRTLKSRIDSGDLVVGDAEQTSGGIVTARMVRKTEECLLDILYDKGVFGGTDTDEAKRRLEAGMWLRILYIEKARMGPGSSFRMDSSGGRCDTADSIPEDVAWNQKCFQDTMRACHPYGTMLTAVCCHDDERYPRNGIAKALSRLADHRGM